MQFHEQNYALKTFKLLSNANRLKIIDLLAGASSGQLTVNTIAKQISLEVNTVSNHLAKLRDNGIVRAMQDGTRMYYGIKDVRILEFIALAQKLCRGMRKDAA